MRSVRLEQISQSLVVDCVAGQREANVLGDVIVAEADRVGVAERMGTDLRTGPDPDARQRSEPLVEDFVGLGSGSFQRSSDPRRPEQRARSSAINGKA
jgi:hypothetical protein